MKNGPIALIEPINKLKEQLTKKAQRRAIQYESASLVQDSSIKLNKLLYVAGSSRAKH